MIYNEPSDEQGFYDGRYAGLRILVWMTEGWPSSAGSHVGQEMLAAWLTGRRNNISRHLGKGNGRVWWSKSPDDFGPRIRKHLCTLLY